MPELMYLPVRENGADGYAPIKVDSRLATWVAQIAVERHPNSTVSDRAYSVFPTPLVVLGFQYRGRLEVLREQGAERLEPCGVTGLQRKVRNFRPSADTRTILVRLRPEAAFRLLGVPLVQLTENHVPLEGILPAGVIRATRERIVNASDISQAARHVESLMLSLSETARRGYHPAVVAAARLIAASDGKLAIDDVAVRAWTSRRTLERLFPMHVGMSPKEFASTVRFDWTMRNLRRRLSWAELALEAGYADQAHMIRSFSLRAGITPAEFARK